MEYGADIIVNFGESELIQIENIVRQFDNVIEFLNKYHCNYLYGEEHTLDTDELENILVTLQKILDNGQSDWKHLDLD